MTNPTDNIEQRAREYSDFEYLLELAKHYDNSPVPEMRAHRERLLKIAAILRSANDDRAERDRLAHEIERSKALLMDMLALLRHDHPAAQLAYKRTGRWLVGIKTSAADARESVGMADQLDIGVGNREQTAEFVRDNLPASGSVETADEPVAKVCLVGERYAHGHFVEVQLQLAAENAPMPKIGDAYYLRPQPASIEGDERITCYGTGPNGERIQAVYSAQAICEMGHMQMLRSCQNSLGDAPIKTLIREANQRGYERGLKETQPAAPITVNDEDVDWFAKLIADAIGHGMREKCMDVARRLLESFAKRKAGGE